MIDARSLTLQKGTTDPNMYPKLWFHLEVNGYKQSKTGLRGEWIIDGYNERVDNLTCDHIFNLKLCYKIFESYVRKSDWGSSLRLVKVHLARKRLSLGLADFQVTTFLIGCFIKVM